MGNRSNIYIQSRHDDEGTYLYSHWGGTQHLQDGLDALQSPLAPPRWYDSDYLTRIIAQHIFDKEGKGNTGLGVGPRLSDNEHLILVLDPKHETAALVPAGCERDRIPDGTPFADAILLDDVAIVTPEIC